MVDYKKYLNGCKKIKKELNFKEFEYSKNQSYFSILKSEMYTDYEFNDLEVHYTTGLDLSSSDKVEEYNFPLDMLMFKKINNNVCNEISTGRIFERTDDGNFYNEETGLFFGFEGKVFFNEDPYSTCLRTIGDIFKYRTISKRFFDYYEMMKTEDNEKEAKAESLLLKKGIKFTK